jgi:type IV pilus assembly protein PilW
MRILAKGFSLVEIMVGLAVGMVAMIVMMQVYGVFEGNKRSATGGSDAQSNGTIALYMIERDARMAGWGIGTTGYENCSTSTTYSYCDGSEECGGTEGSLGLSFNAVTIADGGNDPDTLTIQYFADPNIGTFNFPATTTISKTMPNPSSELDVDSVSGCFEGGMVLVSQGGHCTLMQITQIQKTALKIQHNKGTAGIYNPSADYLNENNWPAYTKGATLTCFPRASTGATFRIRYEIDKTSRNLLKSDNSPNVKSVKEVVSPEILDMKAQYGITAGGKSQTIIGWVDATGATWTSPGAADRNRIKAIRIALVARSSQYEKPDTGKTCATTSAPITTTSMVASWSSWANFNPTNYPGDWQCYRYKVFETVIPLRNVLWANI